MEGNETPVGKTISLPALPSLFFLGRWLVWFFVSTVSLLLITSSIGHFQNPPVYFESLLKYHLIPWPMAMALSLFLPWFQIILAFSLLMIHQRFGFIMAMMLFLVFVAAQATTIARGISTDCGCMGPLYPNPLGWRSLLFPFAGGVCSLIGFMVCRSPAKGKAGATPPALPVDGSGRLGATLLELLVVLAVISLLFGLSVAGIQKVREQANQVGCQNNLKQLALACEGYLGQRGHYPAGCSVQIDQGSHPHQSWIVSILPWVEREDLARLSNEAFLKEKDFLKPPHDPVRATVLPLLICPSNRSAMVSLQGATWNLEGTVIGPSDFALTSYLGVGGKNYKSRDGILFLDSQVRDGDIGDGRSYTILLGERPPGVQKHFGWWYAGWGMYKTGSGDFWMGVSEIPLGDRRFESCGKTTQPFQAWKEEDPCAVFQFWSFHSGGAFFAFGDGSVRFLGYDRSQVLPALATRQGSEVISIQ